MPARSRMEEDRLSDVRKRNNDLPTRRSPRVPDALEHADSFAELPQSADALTLNSMTSNNNKVDTDSAEAPSKGVGFGALVRELVAEDRPISKRFMTVPTRGTVWNHDERGEMVDLVYEEREWICVFCKEPQRYTLINGYCEIGCGAAWTMRDGRSVNSCFKPECQAATERFLSLPNIQ
jgi:hypothetical protein